MPHFMCQWDTMYTEDNTIQRGLLQCYNLRQCLCCPRFIETTLLSMVRPPPPRHTTKCRLCLFIWITHSLSPVGYHIHQVYQNDRYPKYKTNVPDELLYQSGYNFLPVQVNLIHIKSWIAGATQQNSI